MAVPLFVTARKNAITSATKILPCFIITKYLKFVNCALNILNLLKIKKPYVILIMK